MNVGILDIDGHNFPNFALMRTSAFHKAKGDKVEWANPLFGNYDKVYSSKVFTFSPNYDYCGFDCEILKGGTGYDIKAKLPMEIENSTLMDYSIYPQYPFSIQFFSRGCIRHCPFCLVHDKEGNIKSVEPVELNPNGKWIEVLDNNFFANPNWHDAINYLLDKKQPVKLHGVDVRIMNEEQAYYLNKLNMKQNIHIAWDLPNLDLTEQLKSMCRHVKPYKITCYILIGFNSTKEQDLYRLNALKKLGITPFVQPYRDYNNNHKPTNYEKDLARWANRSWLFNSTDFENYSPRNGFKCKEYFR